MILPRDIKFEYMWNDQFKGNESHVGNIQFWVSNNLLVHLKSYILIQTPLRSNIWFHRYERFWISFKQCKTLEFVTSFNMLITQINVGDVRLILFWSCHISEIYFHVNLTILTFTQCLSGGVNYWCSLISQHVILTSVNDTSVCLILVIIRVH